MRKLIWVTVAVLCVLGLLIAGCGKQIEEETTTVSNPEEQVEEEITETETLEEDLSDSELEDIETGLDDLTW